jgi:multiple sugar transport system permease protein
MAAGETLGVLVTSVLAGYSFGRLKFWGRDVLFLLVLGTMMIPSQVTLIPSFIIMKWFGWLNTYQGLIVPRIVTGFGVFLMRQFFLSIPREIEDAARIDGCGRFGVLMRVLLPLVTPALATLAIFTFNNSWNEFFWPLIIASTGDMRTIQVAISSFRGEDTNWGVIMAAVTLAALPVMVVYLVLQRYFVKGIVMSGLKG